MIAWRLAKREAKAAAFSGDGARLYGGRWNAIGTPVVYAATELALAALELVGHVEPSEAAPHYSFKIEIPDELVEFLPLSKLPPGWDSAVPQEATAVIGTEWAKSQRSVALLVPSVHVPPSSGAVSERNVLLNPRHPDFSRLKIGRPRRYLFDARLLPSSLVSARRPKQSLSRGKRARRRLH